MDNQLRHGYAVMRTAAQMCMEPIAGGSNSGAVALLRLEESLRRAHTAYEYGAAAVPAAGDTELWWQLAMLSDLQEEHDEAGSGDEAGHADEAEQADEAGQAGEAEQVGAASESAADESEASDDSEASADESEAN